MGEAPRNSNSGETSPLWGRDVGRSSVTRTWKRYRWEGANQPGLVVVGGQKQSPAGPGVNTPPSVSPQSLSSCCHLLLAASIQQVRDTWGLNLQKSLLPKHRKSSEESEMGPAPVSIPYVVETHFFLEVVRGLMLEAGKETQKKLGYSTVTMKLYVL